MMAIHLDVIEVGVAFNHQGPVFSNLDMLVHFNA